MNTHSPHPAGLRIAVITDAWCPQVNGVVTTLSRVGQCLTDRGDTVRFITPDEFQTIPCPGYREIRLAIRPYTRLARKLESFAPDAIHIATEGPLGWAARRFCLRRGLPFTTAYHTQFPQYLRLRAPVPLSLTFAVLRRFHNASARTLVATTSLREALAKRGFRNLSLWSRGVDSTLFRPYGKSALELIGPIFLFVGRVAVEKNIEVFLALDLPGTKVVVGDGPHRAELEARYPETLFLGYRAGEELARMMASADVFVFPSRTDTFGLTMLEAMACGVPVAAHPVPGPRDVVQDGVTGALDEDLQQACLRALAIGPHAPRAYARSRNWEACAETLRESLVLTHNRSTTRRLPLRRASVVPMEV